ncbi:hypothetical protein [Streptomyces sp. NBC_01006]|uniref:hypothetical protein n=1 Tax=Streptomyces sp. NBC_01006 TaxID=2903716 RepID=UPI003870DCA0|nr:hypothetical protein OG509_00565 [Streptomyces sp. NBC_01006]
MRNGLAELLELPEHEIDLLIAHHLVGEDFGSREDDDEERLFIARRWFTSFQGRLREAVCGNPAVMRAAENPGEGNQFLAATVVDALLHAQLQLDVPVTVLAVKVVHAGLHRLCGTGMTPGQGQSGSD